MVRLWPGRPDREEWPGCLLFMGIAVLLFAVYWAWAASNDPEVLRVAAAAAWGFLGSHYLYRWNRARRSTR